MPVQILTETAVRKLFADAYYNAALTCEAEMKVVCEVLEMIRSALLAANPYKLWSSINFSKYKNDHEKLKKFLFNLKNTYREVLFETLCGQLNESFKRSADEGWRFWFNNYSEAFICSNEVYDRLCTYPFPFPAEALPVVEKLRRLNRLIMEGRWIEVSPLLDMLIDYTLIEPHQRANLQTLSAEIDLYQLLNNEEALRKLQEAEKIISGSSIIKRAFAVYYQKTGDLTRSRKEIFEAIFYDSSDIENYLTMGDTYRDEGVTDVAEKWYRDAMQINFLYGAPYIRLLGIYGSPAKFDEKHAEIPLLLASAEAIDPDNDFNSVIYHGCRDAGSYYSANNKYDDSLGCYKKAIDMHPGWVTAYTDACYVLTMQNNFDEAGIKIEQALKIDPDYYDGKLALAWLEEEKSYKGPEEERNDCTSRAIALYKECIAIRPSTATDFFNTIGVLYGNLNDYESSKEFYLKAIEADPKTDFKNSALYQSNLAFACNKLQEYDQAKEAYLLALKYDPQDPSAYNKLGNVHFACNEFDKAKEYYLKAIELSTDVAVYYENLGKANGELENWANAIDAYKKAIAISSSVNIEEMGNALIYDSIGMAYDKLGKKEEAEQSFLKAIAIDPQNYTFNNRLGILYYQQNKFEEALEYFKKAVSFGNGEGVLLGNVGLAYGKLEQWRQAKDAFQQALVREPGNPFYLNFIGICYYREKNYNEAITYYTKAIERDGKEPVYFENLGLAYEDAGFIAEAKNAYRKLVELAPQTISYYYRLATIFVKENNLEEALKVLREGVSHDPDNPEALNLQGEYEEKLNLYGDALKTYQHALKIVPGDEYFNNRAGICCFNLNDNESAISYYQQAIEANPNVAVYYENLGLSYNQSGQWKNSVNAYEKAIALDPTYKNYNLLGIGYYNLDEADNAIENYKKAISLVNSEAVLYNNLGLAYERAGKATEAEESYLKSIEIEPENYIYRNIIGLFYYLKGDFDNAIDHYQQAIKFGKGEEILFENLGLAYEAAGKPAKALETYQQALIIHPGSELFTEKVERLLKDA